MARPATAMLLLALVLSGCARTTGPAEFDPADFDAAAYYEANCMRCHGGAEGGRISDLPPVHNANGHTWHHGDCVIAGIIREGVPRRAGLPDEVPTMPAFGDELDDRQIAALIDHMRGWWTPDQQAAQAQTTTQQCG